MNARSYRRDLQRCIGALLCLAALSGCRSGAPAAALGVSSEPLSPTAPAAPEALLKWSMAHYQQMRTFQAACAWSSAYSGQPTGQASTRNILYSAPNRFKVVSNLSAGLALTSVSDGKTITEYATGKQAMAMKAAAPATIGDSKSMVLTHPMFCGSLLYQFFGGPAALSKLVDPAKRGVLAGPDVTVNGHACRTVKFYATGLYGNTLVAIGKDDGLVRRIQYGSEPLVAKVAAQMQGRKLTSLTTETYTNLKPGILIADAEFQPALPAGVQAVEVPTAGESKPPVSLGSPAPDFQVASLAGGPVKLSSLRGSVVLLDFWATWCGPCRKGLPETQRLAAELSSKGLKVMAISDEESGTVKPFLTKYHFSFPCFLDSGKEANRAYRISAIPTVAVIDRQGNLSAYMVGLQGPDTLRNALKKAGLPI